MGRDASGAGARWQGYSHRELYEMIHSGPGSGAAGAVADTWSGMSGALSEIQQDINTGVTASGATWDGAAADSARGALGPLGEWAQQASTAADVMRASVELQGDLLGKARADMPVPVGVPQQSQIGQLVTSQVDFEVAEMASRVAEQQAFQVMAQYEAATTDNVTTLGDFGEPPLLVVDTAPITGIPVRRADSFPAASSSRPARSTATTGSAGSRSRGSSGRVVEEPPSARSTSTSSQSSSSSSRSSTSTSSRDVPASASGPAEKGPAGHDRVITASPDEVTPMSAPPSTPATRPTSGAPAAAAPDRVAGSSVIGGSTTPSSAQSGSSDGRDRKTTGSSVVTPPSDRFAGTAVVPAARRPGEEDDPDVHRSRYLIEADDIYGSGRTYSPPVIGESRPRR